MKVTEEHKANVNSINDRN